LEYYPWSNDVLSTSIKEFSCGKLPCLDLELGASCQLKAKTGGCIYCDSNGLVGKHNPAELSVKEICRVIDQGVNLGLKWVYICGLGEPTDDPKAKDVIKYLSHSKVKMSMFSNGINYSDENIEFFFENKVNLIIKCDSFDPDIFNYLLGGNKAKSLHVADSVYETIGKLIKIGYSQTSNDPSLALSIVLTNVNLSKVPEIIEFCKTWNVFPLLGELENAGRASVAFNELSPSENQLSRLRDIATEILGYNYEIPVCPAAFSGLHINNMGDCIVHKQSGSSCAWFSLVEPETEVLGNVRVDSLANLRDKLIQYRKNLKESNNLAKWLTTVWSENQLSHVFGGCGGRKLMELWAGEERDE